MAMSLALIKVFIAATVISFCSWLSDKRPELAGYIVALPIATLVALAFSQIEWGNTANTIRFAKSILVALPFSLLFFIPFLLADRFGLSFWSCYASGLALLLAGYFMHKLVMELI
jgi:hypothetical protein